MKPRSALLTSDILSLPAAHTVVLSPSDRARRGFARVWARDARRKAGRDAVALPRFVTINNWIANTWSDAQLFGLIDDTRTLISPATEAALWRHIARDVASASSAESAALADRFAEAWMLEHGYGGNANPSRPTPFALGASGELFRDARTEFVKKLREANALTSSELPHSLSQAAENWRMLVPQHLFVTPVFAGRGSEISLLSIIKSKSLFTNSDRVILNESISSKLHRIRCANVGLERDDAIAWARQQLSGERAELGDQVAIVVPELQRSRGTWQRALREADLPFNISLGLPVSKYPWAAAGFTLVSAIFTPTAPETIAQALRHPRWGRSEATTTAINRRELLLLRAGESETTLAEFCDVREHEPNNALGQLHQKLSSCGLTLNKFSGRQSRAHWRRVFDLAITALSESAVALSSQTFQLREALLSSIEVWQSLDALLPQISINEAQQELVAMTDQSAFQPEGSDAPVQVIGLLESAGVPFDAMRVTGLCERALPEAPRSNPFLSAAWQREVRAGLASIDECADRARRMVDGWCALAPDVSASLADEVDDEPQVWSPLVVDWELHPASENVLASPIAHRASADVITAIDDERAPQWRAEASRGARALEAQALCPRRGFAEGRLRLSAWPEVFDGFSPRLRGELVHGVAERLGKLRIAGTEQSALVDHLPQAVRETIDAEQNKSRRIPPHVWDAEEMRLLGVFENLLEKESRRPSFDVLFVEKEISTEIGGVNFSLRIDRVDGLSIGNAPTDQVERQKIAVVDFKSGAQVDRKGLFDERLTAPQLPLYGHAIGLTNVEAVAYARVSDDHQDFVGIGHENSGLSANTRGRAPPPPWESIRDSWTHKLTLLANELVEGTATLAPAYGEATCTKCDFHSFCRVDLTLLDSFDVTELNRSDTES